VYVERLYNYFHDFMSPVEYATMKFEIAIENDRSLKLRQTRQVNTSLSSTTHTTDHKRRSHSPSVGFKEGKEWVERGREWVEKRRRSRRSARWAQPNHYPPIPYHIPPHPHP
jgi:hypothetical protein